MWCFSEHGFFTFVVDRKDSSYVWLRARMREHLEDNFPGIEVTEHPGADYYFRAKVTKAYLAEQMTRLVMDANITSHFKDEMNRRAAKPKWGSISQVMYAVWNGAAQWQPFAPYSRVPRPEPKPFVPSKQGALFPDYSRYGGARAGDYDWSTGAWKGGTKVGESAPDPRVNQGDIGEEVDPVRARQIADMLDGLSEDDFDEIWPTLSESEQAAYLDYQEELADEVDAGSPQAPAAGPATPAPVFSHTEEDHGAQARLDEWFTARQENAYAAPRGGGRRRKKRRRK